MTNRITGHIIWAKAFAPSTLLIVAAFSLLFFAGPISAQEDDPEINSNCIVCHDEAVDDHEVEYEKALARSIHTDLACIDCHSEISELPHEETLPKVDCGTCHDSEVEVYQYHGALHVDSDPDIPDCSDCHGKHDILPSSEKASSVNTANVHTTCGNCHADVDLTKKHEILYGQPVDVYESSVHGKAAIGGLYTAATCIDCHSTGGTAHRILSPGNSESSTSHFNIPETCGQCHKNVERDYWEGIHGKLVKRGKTDSPVCTDCHGEHGIIAADNPESRVSPARVAEATCTPCHESARLNDRYGRPGGRESWVDSYHGLKSQSGDLTVANCSSCHGAHRILASTDSTSSISANNLQHTCGQCHPGISEEMAATKIHADPGVEGNPLADMVKNIYIILIVLTIGGMIIHWSIDILKHMRWVNAQPQVTRMQTDEIIQHFFLATTFIVLVITGFSLRYTDSWWTRILFGYEGGAEMRGVIHRVSAVAFCLTTVWHTLYLLTTRGRQFLRDMLPAKHDISQAIQMIKYNLGLAKERPPFGRFSYIEKVEYWALVWGTVVMVITGFALWFDDWLMSIVGRETVDVVLVVHYYEAILATLAIIIWHLYSTVFSPEVYPMNPAWYTGKMPRNVYQHEHPNDPVFKNEQGQTDTDSDKTLSNPEQSEDTSKA